MTILGRLAGDRAWLHDVIDEYFVPPSLWVVPTTTTSRICFSEPVFFSCCEGCSPQQERVRSSHLTVLVLVYNSLEVSPRRQRKLCLLFSMRFGYCDPRRIHIHVSTIRIVVTVLVTATVLTPGWVTHIRQSTTSFPHSRSRRKQRFLGKTYNFRAHSHSRSRFLSGLRMLRKDSERDFG